MPHSRALGIDLGGTKIEAVLLSPLGAELWRRRIDTPAGDYAGTLQAVAGLVAQAQREGDGPCGVGLGTPGSQTPEGLMKNANSQCLNGRPLQADLQRLLGQPVRLANDANCLALSEAVDGAGAGAEVVFAVILGTGVGGGWVVRGELLAGANGLAGEWGHNPLPWPAAAERPGPPCYCGLTGCIETWLAGPAFERECREATGEALAAPAIVARAA